MSKIQSQSTPSSHHFKINIQNRKPFLRPSLSYQNHQINQINQNSRKIALPQRTVSTDVFTILPLETYSKNSSPSSSPIEATQKRQPTQVTIHKSSPKLFEQQARPQTEKEQLKFSFIQELLCLDNCLQTASRIPQKKIGLQQLNIIETQSFQEDDSSILDRQSQVMALTQEEQHFFSNYIIAEMQESQEDDCMWITEHMAKKISGHAPLQQASALQERKKVIRNFFRPKASFFKDDKTRCNSSTNLDQINQSPSRNNLSPKWADHQKSTSTKSSNKFLSPLLTE